MTNHLNRLADGTFILLGIVVIAVLIRTILSQPTLPPSVLALFALVFVTAYALGYGMEVVND